MVEKDGLCNFGVIEVASVLHVRLRGSSWARLLLSLLALQAAVGRLREVGSSASLVPCLGL